MDWKKLTAACGVVGFLILLAGDFFYISKYFFKVDAQAQDIKDLKIKVSVIEQMQIDVAVIRTKIENIETQIMKEK